eukprot:CAMPEP_0203749686 /NCGR_PEP_ID=MMETSP0098-20131031/4152_1 /ASSEMBLY_ACC=CAM_ASM_000208 /TAXON_ID=96639 /ORGANISM=" , Strain NY0313808BC1" /LENGTH=59 /DNA_ID=CAMNT_0050638779 /DNA_START=143 /DNA_END=319 /DNA_ORIENTATION=+
MDRVADLEKRVEELELLGPRFTPSSDQDSDSDLAKENAQLKQHVAGLEYRIGILVRSLE